jgi:putative transposase
MSLVPRYNYPSGTEVTLFSQEMALNAVTDDGYELTNIQSGNVSVVSFAKFAEYLKSPAMHVENTNGISANAVELRLGGFKVAEQLAKFQQELGEFHFAICCGMDALRTKRRQEIGPKGDHLSIAVLNDVKNRKFICITAEQFFGQKINLSRVRGGKNVEWVLYKGRTLQKYDTIYRSLGPEDDTIAALVTLDHLKGNETRRFNLCLLELMTQAWEEIGLDLKGPSVANVHRHLEMLVREENTSRRRNQITPLIVPSQKTLRAHRDDLLSPTEYLLATKGERYTRGKRGRGSSDIRALTSGEVAEIDECRVSLITSAKEKGYWHTLSEKEQATLEEIDQEIRSRLMILVMIDVATRMPLAWVVSDQARAEATMALLRMATRDKTKEKIRYGCSGDPTPAMGIGMIKNDNGVGLRNAKIKQATLGLGTYSTDVRTYASADKPFVERFFGATESILIKLIHGYTGRNAGELPGYDAKANGILDIDELYGILTRFFIDEYPSMRHTGIGMGGRRPAEMFKTLNDTRGLFRPLDEDQRRVHLGWPSEVTPNDEGVRVFSGIWYNSDELQKVVDDPTVTKVTVFVDPDDVNEATVITPHVNKPVRVQLQITAFADMTLPQVLELMQAHRKEDPEITEIHEDRLAKTRRQRFDQLKAIGVERRLSNSSSTFEECKTKSRAVFAGARIIQTTVTENAVRPGEIMSSTTGPGVYNIGNGGVVIEHDDPVTSPEVDHSELANAPLNEPQQQATENARGHKRLSDKKQQFFGRPKNGGTLL